MDTECYKHSQSFTIISVGASIILHMMACANAIPHRYDSMLACWKMDPTERPTFSQLVVSLSGILDQLAEYFDLNAENHTSGCGSTSIGIQEEQQKLNPSLTLEDQSDQPSENVSLPASTQHCASNESQEFVQMPSPYQ